MLDTVAERPEGPEFDTVNQTPEERIAEKYGLEMTNALRAYTDDIQKGERAMTVRRCEHHIRDTEAFCDRRARSIFKELEILNKRIQDGKATDQTENAIGQNLRQMLEFQFCEGMLKQARERISEWYEKGDLPNTSNTVLRIKKAFVVVEDECGYFELALSTNGPRHELGNIQWVTVSEFAKRTNNSVEDTRAFLFGERQNPPV